MVAPKQGLLFVISGPSGSGKTTLAKNLLNVRGLQGRLAKSVSFTTRPQRPGEVEGRDYFFISEKRFRALQKAKKILEWTRYLGYYYATSRDFIAKERSRGKHVILCLDLKGADKIRRTYPKDTVTIFIMPPSLGSLRSRIRKRSRTSRQEEMARLRLAKQELIAAKDYDYQVFNKKLASALKELKTIVLSRIDHHLKER